MITQQWWTPDIGRSSISSTVYILDGVGADGKQDLNEDICLREMIVFMCVNVELFIVVTSRILFLIFT